MSNLNLIDARMRRDDEYYTLAEDVERELAHYRPWIENADICCPCDDPDRSAFPQTLMRLGAASCTASAWSGRGMQWQPSLLDDDPPERPARRVILHADGTRDITRLHGDGTWGAGDFRSRGVRDAIRDADLTVTNPPFSLFRDFISLLDRLNKPMLLVGPLSAITYTNVFPLIQAGRLRLGYETPRGFKRPDGSVAPFGNIVWYTTLPVRRGHAFKPTVSYDPAAYDRYANYDAIEVSHVADIPKDYMKPMGVPIGFLNVYDPDDWELLGLLKGDMCPPEYRSDSRGGGPILLHDGRARTLYPRLLIRRRNRS